MPVGGAETLLVNLVRRFDRRRISPQVCCLKHRGPLGEELARQMTVHCQFIRHRLDVGVLFRLLALFRRERIDAVVTVGSGDKMFWGRLAARAAGVPVVISALHSTGWPDGVGRLNRALTPLTDAFIGVAPSHARFLVEHERFPEHKVFVIPNGVDTERFRPLPDRAPLRQELDIPREAPVAGIVAALRPEKNHSLFLRAAAGVLKRVPRAVFLVVGDGPERDSLERLARELAIPSRVRFLGNRSDVPRILSVLDVFALTSHNEANPVSILEAMSCGIPVVATDVGSVRETVRDGQTGFLIDPGDEDSLMTRMVDLLTNRGYAEKLGRHGRQVVQKAWSLEQMVQGYEQLILQKHHRKLAAKWSFRLAMRRDRMEFPAR